MPKEKMVELEDESPVEIDLSTESSEDEEVLAENSMKNAEFDTDSDDLPSEEELKTYSVGVRKRIDKLTAKFRESERREQAALDYARSIKSQNDSLQKQQESLNEYAGKEYAGRVSTDLESAKKRYSSAYESGDVDELVNATQDLSRLSVENATLNNQIPALKAVPQQMQTMPLQPPDPKSQEWARRNSWFGTDEPMTYTAFAIHKQLVEQGMDPNSDQYYSTVDSRIREEFPHKFAVSEQAAVEVTPSSAKNSGRQSVQRVASANRAAKNSGRNTIKLTPSQVSIAHKLGVSLEDYARQVKEIESHA
jgi:hypothetical protein